MISISFPVVNRKLLTLGLKRFKGPFFDRLSLIVAMQATTTIADLYFFSELQEQLSDVAAHEWRTSSLQVSPMMRRNDSSAPSLQLTSSDAFGWMHQIRAGNSAALSHASAEDYAGNNHVLSHSSDDWDEPPMLARSNSESVRVLCSEMSNPGLLWTDAAHTLLDKMAGEHRTAQEPGRVKATQRLGVLRENVCQASSPPSARRPSDYALYEPGFSRHQNGRVLSCEDTIDQLT